MTCKKTESVEIGTIKKNLYEANSPPIDLQNDERNSEPLRSHDEETLNQAHQHGSLNARQKL